MNTVLSTLGALHRFSVEAMLRSFYRRIGPAIRVFNCFVGGASCGLG